MGVLSDTLFPVRLNQAGGLDVLDDFAFDASGSYRSCGAVINGLMLIFGGDETGIERQISIVESCQLRRVGTLPFNFERGACNTFLSANDDDVVYLCFPWSSGRQSWKLELEQF